jgi:signal peptidase I
MSAKRLARGASLIAVMLGTAAVTIPAVGIATGRWRLVPILSGSMAPGIPTGSLALATPSSSRSIHRDQVIIFEIPVGDHHLTAHRVVRVIRGGLHPVVETKGDANNGPDPWQVRLSGATAWQVRTAIPLLGYAAVDVRRARLLPLAFTGLVAVALCWRLLWRRPSGDPEGVVPPRVPGTS